MKTPVFLIFLSVAIIGLSYAAYEITASQPAGSTALSWHSYDEGAALAVKQNKKILVDVFTDWCGWCKKMDKEVYTSHLVESALTKNFILVKLDAESPNKLTYEGKQYSEQELAQAFGVTGYPTTVFLQQDSRPITSLDGFVEADRFATILTYIGDDHYKTTSFKDYLTKSGKNQ